ncbi:hypothetical protein GGQ84_000502 [Desulfitispora alkaliphila]|uniref:hypothetical protein n=1 Tax=Desulfitispora alkaliphila TaxID=622674 RepID=UPI003D1D1DB0
MKKFRNNEEKIQYVLDGIEEGKSTDDIAKDLGYKNYKSLDMFMRREGYIKEKRLGNYFPKNGRGIIQNENKPHKASITNKALEIIKRFNEGEMSPKRIAHESGFETSKEMANYMKSKGFIWDSHRNNYIPEQKEIDLEPTEDLEEGEYDEEFTIERFKPLLEYLFERKEKLVEIIESNLAGESGSMPRYVVPGIFLTKSVHMSNQLDQMVRDFSADHNISQRDIFEVALVDFFKKYGYHKEVETMLKSIE